MLDFIVLGLIPGTNIAVGFYIYLALLTLGIAFGVRNIKAHKHKLEEQEKNDRIKRMAI